IAFQASPDHPWVKEHPGWFRHRPDGSIKYAENPPKKYQDIYPIDFESAEWESLWRALRDVFVFWIGHGVRTFRADNPHRWTSRVRGPADSRRHARGQLWHLQRLRAVRERADQARVRRVPRLGEIPNQATRLESSRQPSRADCACQSHSPRTPRPPAECDFDLLPDRQSAFRLVRQVGSGRPHPRR